MAGDCFVVVTTDWQYWTGDGWSPKIEEALCFGGPLNAYSEANALAKELRRREGRVCNAAYIPRPKVRVRKVPEVGQVLRRSARRKKLDVAADATPQVNLGMPDIGSLPNGLNSQPNLLHQPT